jgi:hypothetical protein
MACLDDDAHTQEKLMRLPGTPDTEAPAQPDAALIKALSREYVWHKRLV